MKAAPTIVGARPGNLVSELRPRQLTSLRGVGRWSAEYVLLRGLGRLNVVPGDDVGARNNLARFVDAHAPLDYAGVHELLERWQPSVSSTTSRHHWSLPAREACSSAAPARIASGRAGKEPPRDDAGGLMTRISTSAESVAIGDGASGEQAPRVRPQALDAVRREFRRSRRLAAREGWTADRLREQLPRVTLDEALEIVLDRRGEPRFDAGAVAWHARLEGHAPQLTLDDAERALAALERLGGPSPEVGALELRALCERYRLEKVASVLDEWLTQRQSFGGF